MMKIYLYGYLNRIQSSRRLERETHRNIELIWLTQRLNPDYKTIADFRKNNSEAIKNTCTQFIHLCRGRGLFEGTEVAVDGSKFKAVNSPDKNLTLGSVKQRISRAEDQIERYLGELDRADREDNVESQKTLNNKLSELKRRIERLSNIGKEIEQSDQTQISLSDPDSRAMKSRKIGTMVGRSHRLKPVAIFVTFRGDQGRRP